MGDKWGARSVSAWRLFWLGVSVGFLLDVVSHTWSVFRLGLPVTLSNVAAYSTRALHAEVWIISGLVCFIVSSYVVGQALRAVLDGRKNGRTID